MPISTVVSERQFPWSHPPPVAFTIFLSPLPHRSLALEGKSLIKTLHLEISAPMQAVLLWISLLIPIYLQEDASLMKAK